MHNPITNKTKSVSINKSEVARAHFAKHGPADAPPLPLSYDEREDIKEGRGLLSYLVALHARSLDSREYDVKEHPPFAHHVSGILWEAERVDGDIGTLPNYPDQLSKLKKRFPPRKLAGLGPGFCWEPPKLQARTMASQRRSIARCKKRRSQ
jgi:hypothetical protein